MIRNLFEAVNEVSPPLFPLCKRLRGYLDATESQWWLSCLDISRELGHSASKKYLIPRFAHAADHGLKVPLQQWTASHDWDGSSWKPLPFTTNDKPEWMVRHDQIEPFSLWTCSGSRKTAQERLALLAKFNLQPPAQAIKVPIETELLTILAACAPVPMKTQYRVGNYRLDAYFERLHLAIQIDEHGHSGYDPEEEKEYNSVLRQHNIVCIRFNPHQKFVHPAFCELIKEVWARTLSPDFIAFRERNHLA